VRRKDRPLQPSTLETQTSARLAEIVEAAERAAKKVIDDAESEGRRYLSEAQAEADRIVSERLTSLAEMTDLLVAQAEAIRHQSQHLLDSLEETKAQLGVDGVAAPGSTPESPDVPAAERGSRGSHLSAVAPVMGPADEVSAPDRPSPEGGSPAGARLLATQMAVSGNSREEIEARLRNGFEIDDTDAILDAILGPEE
jgi:vacuolar-type H+-ATPase subunit H